MTALTPMGRALLEGAANSNSDLRAFPDETRAAITQALAEIDRLREQRNALFKFNCWVGTFLDSEMVESWIRCLRWSDGTPDEILTLVHGNVRGFAGSLKETLREKRRESIPDEKLKEIGAEVNAS